MTVAFPFHMMSAVLWIVLAAGAAFGALLGTFIGLRADRPRGAEVARLTWSPPRPATKPEREAA
jgi:hypothetical protein